MSKDLKAEILKELAETHRDLEKAIEGLDLDLVIHPETDWRILDILGHIATWDRILIKAIESHLEGSEYVIQGMDGVEDEFNEEQVRNQKDISSSQIVEEWNQARVDFIAAVDLIPDEKFSDELAFPWGDESGPLSLMIEYMVEHNGEHQEEIEEAIRS